MGGVDQPFLYSRDTNDARFPQTTFDPKAVTRASWESKPPKAKTKQDGPLLSLNRHPEYVASPVASCGELYLTQLAVPTRFRLGGRRLISS